PESCSVALPSAVRFGGSHKPSPLRSQHIPAPPAVEGARPRVVVGRIALKEVVVEGAVGAGDGDALEIIGAGDARALLDAVDPDLGVEAAVGVEWGAGDDVQHAAVRLPAFFVAAEVKIRLLD